MPTSGVSAWSLTARDICTIALQENGIIRLGREMRAAELAACIVRLNGMLKSMMPGGHREATATVTVPANSASGVLDAGMGEIVAVRRIVANGNDYPLYRMERGDYQILPNKTQSGLPLAYSVNEQLAAQTLYVWPVPTANTDLSVDYIRMPDTVTDAGQTVDIPEKYTEAVYSILAVRCAGIFGVQPSQELVMRAMRLETEMLDRSRPESYRLGAWNA